MKTEKLEKKKSWKNLNDNGVDYDTAKLGWLMMLERVIQRRVSHRLAVAVLTLLVICMYISNDNNRFFCFAQVLRVERLVSSLYSVYFVLRLFSRGI